MPILPHLPAKARYLVITGTAALNVDVKSQLGRAANNIWVQFNSAADSVNIRFNTLREVERFQELQADTLVQSWIPATDPNPAVVVFTNIVPPASTAIIYDRLSGLEINSLTVDGIVGVAATIVLW